MGQKKRYQTRLPADKAEQLDEYRDDRDISKSEAVRRLVVRQLESGTAQDSDSAPARSSDTDVASDTDTDTDEFEWTHLRVLLAVLVAGYIGSGAWELGARAGDALFYLGVF